MRRLIIFVGLSLFLCFAFGQVAFAEFTDMNEAANYQWEAIQDLNELGIILGYPGGEFKPQADCTRGDAAMIVYRALNYLESKIPSVDGLINAEQATDLIQKALDDADYATNTALGDTADEIYTAIQDLEIAFRDDLDAMDLRVTTLEERTDALEIQVNDLDGAVSDLQAAVEEQNASISALQAGLASTQAALEAAKAQAKADAAAAMAEAKHAKNLSILGIILGILGIIF